MTLSTSLSKTNAQGEAEIGMQQINVILPVAGADYVGPLPAELRGYVDFAVGVLAVSKQRDAAQALVKFMSSPEAARHPQELHGAAAAPTLGHWRWIRQENRKTFWKLLLPVYVRSPRQLQPFPKSTGSEPSRLQNGAINKRYVI